MTKRRKVCGSYSICVVATQKSVEGYQYVGTYRKGKCFAFFVYGNTIAKLLHRLYWRYSSTLNVLIQHRESFPPVYEMYVMRETFPPRNISRLHAVTIKTSSLAQAFPSLHENTV